VDVFKEIHRMLHEGQEWEARELFFEVALPWLEGKRSRGKLIENQRVNFLGFAHGFC
jgi:hypothetical protein